MKRFIKRITAFLTVLSFTQASFLSGAEGLEESTYATTNQMDSRIAGLLYVHYGTELNETDVISYGNEIPIYNYTEGVIEESDILKMYPVYINNILKGYVSETIESGCSYFSYSEEFAENIVDLEIEQYNFIYSEDSVYVSSEDGTELISGDLTAFKDVTISEKQPVSMNYYSLSSKTNPINVTSLYNNRSNNITFALDIPAKHIATSLGLCWAGCVEAVGEYMTNNTALEPSTIASYMGIGSGGAYNSQVKDALSRFYGINTENNESIPSFSYLVSKINAGKPVIANLQSTSAGHYVTIIGYGATSSKYYLRLMDTELTDHRTVELVNGTFSCIYNVETFSWYNAIIPV